MYVLGYNSLTRAEKHLHIILYYYVRYYTIGMPPTVPVSHHDVFN